ncbi:MAG: hypothetical protein JJE51_02355 [Thermoanaerobaculia bacterium]|nr:hypothetical protein [Thermoanaerobaculia bacterium]
MSLHFRISVARHSALEVCVAALETKLAKSPAIKQGMTPELLTGAIRLPVDAPAMTV